MKVYSIFLVVLMMVNFGLIFYSKKNKSCFYMGLISFIGYFLAIYSHKLFLSKEYNLFLVSSILVFAQMVIFFKLFESKWIFLIVSLICYLRYYGLVPFDSLNQGDFVFFLIISGVGGVCFLWIICCFFIKRHWIKNLLLILLSACIVNISIFLTGYNHVAILKGFYDFNAFFTAINIGIAFIFYPFCLAFFYLGEILLFFLLCYEIFLKNSKNPPTKSNPQPPSPKES